MTDLRSRVAIVTSDKERLYQEKSDLSTKIEDISVLNRQLQGVMIIKLYHLF